jgi:hypothetical protein
MVDLGCIAAPPPLGIGTLAADGVYHSRLFGPSQILGHYSSFTFNSPFSASKEHVVYLPHPHKILTMSNELFVIYSENFLSPKNLSISLMYVQYENWGKASFHPTRNPDS